MNYLLSVKYLMNEDCTICIWDTLVILVSFFSILYLYQRQGCLFQVVIEGAVSIHIANK